ERNRVHVQKRIHREPDTARDRGAARLRLPCGRERSRRHEVLPPRPEAGSEIAETVLSRRGRPIAFTSARKRGSARSESKGGLMRAKSRLSRARTASFSSSSAR